MSTLKDIAVKSNSSVSAVSRVLRNDTTLQISDTKRELILQTAKDLNYKHKNKWTNTTFLIVNWYNQEGDIIDPYYSYITKSVKQRCSELNIDTREMYIKNVLTDFEHVDGVIAIGKFNEDDARKMELFSQNITFIDSLPNSLKYDSVVIDFKETIYNVVDQFIKDKFQHIGFIGGIERYSDNEEILDMRYETFINYTKRKNVYNENLISRDEFTVESGYKQAKDLLSKNTLYPLALFCASDLIAIGVMRACKDLELNIPKDVSIVGFDNIPLTKYLTPSLTTVNVPLIAMGVEAVNITNTNSKDKLTAKKIVLPTELIFRETYIKGDN